MPQGELAIVLHTHMPYIEGFGTWPFGEEWLWEAIATSYLPLLDVLDEAAPAPLTLSLTPVLADQLERPDAMQRCLAFLREIRPESHRLDIAELRAAGDGPAAAELERSAAEYAAAAAASGARSTSALRWAATRAGPRRRPTPCCRWWPPTRGVEPPGADRASRRIGGGSAPGTVASGCPSAPTRRGWIRSLERVGVRSTCVELTGQLGFGDPRHLRPLRSEAGLGAVADRPVDDRAGVGRGRISVASPVSRLPPPHDPPPSRLANRRRRLLVRGGARAGSGRRRGFRGPRTGSGGRRRAVRLRARHRAARPLVV